MNKLNKLKKLVVLALTLSLMGCATKTIVIDTSCSSFRLIKLSRADVITEGTEVQIAGHNGAWRSVCAKGK